MFAFLRLHASVVVDSSVVSSMETMDYSDFLAQKRQLGGRHGFAPVWMPSFLFDFQRALVEWATWKGRAALFCDCGMGKTPMQLVWAQNVVQHTNRPVLIVAPLAASAQTVREAEKFSIKVERSWTGSHRHGGTAHEGYEERRRIMVRHRAQHNQWTRAESRWAEDRRSS